ncbi:MAG TPA: peptidylprolyl isomerase [Allosphingosinicella sp.]|jgi:peptidyl-prolyl cis-trans isomerase A (cyclophilin A)|nr:peptidylprolyl isomerase [Allosphingosinicella sp.]
MIRLLPCVALLSLALAACGQDSSPPTKSTGNSAANISDDNPLVGVPTHSFDPPVPKHLPDIVRVRMETSAGTIVLALDHKHAPVTTTNFVRYVDDHRFDGTSFYRVARNTWAPDQGFIQGGIAHNIRLMLPPIKLEPTTQTGLKHVDGTISMAHATPDTAMGDFTIDVGVQPGLDAHPGNKDEDKGFAAFGQVVEGMDVVRRILAAPTVPYKGKPSENVAAPVKIIRVTPAG